MAVVIADLLPEPVKIEVGRGALTVRGLPLEEIVPLIVRYKDDIAPFFAGEQPDLEGLLLSAPALAADIIAIGVGAIGQEEDIRRMPAATQVECLLAIWHQSVPDIKKLRESLLTVVASISLNPEKATEDLLVSSTEPTSPKLQNTSSVKGTPSEKSEDTPPDK